MSEPTIHPRALPDDRPADALHVRPNEDESLSISPALAGWRYLSFWLDTVDGRSLVDEPSGQEQAIVVIGGGGLDVTVGARRFELPGRESVFDGLPSALYVPPGNELTIRGLPTKPERRVTFATASAPMSGRASSPDPILIIPDDIRVEIRGAGNATRQINHIIAPDFPADRLEVVEVLTPSGNWSSWPPHKHDVDDMPAEAVLEEIYHYRFRRPEAWAIQRVYRADRSRDGIWEVRDGDVVIVPDGYHPFSAAHGDDAYYLNALAGDRRTMACSFDPDLDWVRDTWSSMEPDPRVPLVPPVASSAVS